MGSRNVALAHVTRPSGIHSCHANVLFRVGRLKTHVEIIERRDWFVFVGSVDTLDQTVVIRMHEVSNGHARLRSIHLRFRNNDSMFLQENNSRYKTTPVT